MYTRSATAASETAISPICSSAPAVSPVWPPICRRHKPRMTMKTASNNNDAATDLATPRLTSSTTKPMNAATVATLRVGRPAPAERPSDRADGTSRRNSGIMARAPAWAAIRVNAAGPGPARLAERADAQEERQHQPAGPIGADAAVAHDLELALAVAAAAETIERIGEPVLMQGAGYEEGRGDRERRADERRQIEREGEPIGRCTEETNERADHRQRPAGTRDVRALDRGRVRQRNPGGKQHADPKIGGDAPQQRFSVRHCRPRRMRFL